MESQNKCSKCEFIFLEETPSFKMPCKHILCLKCFEISFNSEKKSIICPLDQKSFNMQIQNTINEEFSQKLICNKHNEEEIKFVHSEKKEFICAICSFENHYNPNDVKLYLKKDFQEDVKMIEDKLLDLEKNLKKDIKNIKDFRLKKYLNSKEIQNFFSNSFNFLRNIDPKFNLKCFDEEIIENQEIIHNNIPKLFKVRLQEFNDELAFNKEQMNIKLEEINCKLMKENEKIKKKLEDQIFLIDKKMNEKIQLFNEQVLQNSQLINDQMIQKLTGFETILKDFNIFYPSDILKIHPNRLYLIEIFKSEGKQIKQLTRIYRASDHQFKSSKFHEICDKRGPTLVVIQAKDSKRVFGGYASESWCADKGYHSAPGSFLFQLDFKTKHTIYQNPDNAMFSGSNYNPVFGGGSECDILLYSDCNKVSNQTFSNLGKTYSLPLKNAVNNNNNNDNNNELSMNFKSEEAKSYLANSYNFAVSDFEVFTINFD